MNHGGEYPTVLPDQKKWYSYRPWKGAVLWLGATSAGVLAFGFGTEAAMTCALGFVAALVWSSMDR